MFSRLTMENKVLLKNLLLQLKSSEGFVLFLFLNKYTNLYVFWFEICWLFLTLLYYLHYCITTQLVKTLPKSYLVLNIL